MINISKSSHNKTSKKTISMSSQDAIKEAISLRDRNLSIQKGIICREFHLLVSMVDSANVQVHS